MARLVNAQVPEVVQPFWAALHVVSSSPTPRSGRAPIASRARAGVAACGGVRPRRGHNIKGRCLTFGEREELALARARGETMRAIARRLGRSPSTISRELRRNADRDGSYRPTMAHALAFERASRPKPAKLARNQRLRQVVQDDRCRRFSPEQIAGRLRRRFPEDPEMWVSAETIYQSLYVHSRGALKRELTRYLRTGRALRKPGRQPGQRKNRIPDMVHISQRPPEVDDRPGAQGADAARAAAAPAHLGPGPRDARLEQVRVDADIEVFFCDPHAPWQRGINENTNGLLRQYFPKGTDFSAVTDAELDAVADELNIRPCKRLNFANPTEQLTELLLQ